MQLADIANLVCQKSGLVGAENLAACKTFATRRHEMIYNDQLWRDSLFQLTYVVDRRGLLLKTDGTPDFSHADADFSTREFSEDTKTLISGLTSIQQTRAINDVYGIFTMPSLVDRVVAMRSSTQHLNVQSAESYYRIDYEAFFQSGTPQDWQELSRAVFSLPYIQSASPALWLDDDADDGLQVTAQIIDSRYNARSVTYTVNKQTPCYLADAFINNPDSGTTILEVSSLTKKSTTGIVRLGYVETAPGYFYYNQVPPYNTLVLMNPADTSATASMRVRILPPPNSDLTLRILFKKKCPDFAADGDTPGVRNMDNVLIAFTTSDMWSRARQLNKANVFAQEGTALLDRLIQLEAVQSGNEKQMIPESGFGTAVSRPASGRSMF